MRSCLFVIIRVDSPTFIGHIVRLIIVHTLEARLAPKAWVRRRMHIIICDIVGSKCITQITFAASQLTLEDDQRIVRTRVVVELVGHANVSDHQKMLTAALMHVKVGGSDLALNIAYVRQLHRLDCFHGCNAVFPLAFGLHPFNN